MVLVGFSSHKAGGAFTGKFEIDVPPATFGPAGGSPEGLELTDVYALTVEEEAGLETDHIELVPDVP